jgi:hypothetical protein
MRSCTEIHKTNLKMSSEIKSVKSSQAMVFNATFNNILVISLRPVLLVEETGLHGKTTDLPSRNSR